MKRANVKCYVSERREIAPIDSTELHREKWFFELIKNPRFLTSRWNCPSLFLHRYLLLMFHLEGNGDESSEGTGATGCWKKARRSYNGLKNAFRLCKIRRDCSLSVRQTNQPPICEESRRPIDASDQSYVNHNDEEALMAGASGVLGRAISMGPYRRDHLPGMWYEPETPRAVDGSLKRCTCRATSNMSIYRVW